MQDKKQNIKKYGYSVGVRYVVRVDSVITEESPVYCYDFETEMTVICDVVAEFNSWHANNINLNEYIVVSYFRK